MQSHKTRPQLRIVASGFREAESTRESVPTNATIEQEWGAREAVNRTEFADHTLESVIVSNTFDRCPIVLTWNLIRQRMQRGVSEKHYTTIIRSGAIIDEIH